MLSLISSLYASDLITLKVSDGKSAYCKTKYDAYRNKLGAYMLKGKSISINNETLLININVTALKCKSRNGRFQFQLMQPYQNLVYRSGKNLITVDVLDARIKGYVDGEYELLVDKVLSDHRFQLMTLRISKDELLTNQDRENLKNGKTIKKSLDLWMNKLLRFHNVTTNKISRSQNNFGAYRLHFKLEETNTGMIVELL